MPFYELRGSMQFQAFRVAPRGRGAPFEVSRELHLMRLMENPPIEHLAQHHVGGLS
ncbi:MAG: hypothetical protein KJN97_01710 [Deltaproteobacteria bacterium]|nr:hypothetical protein [Deltaproteobacteria bacterium]